jgi:hypothetical protein
MLRKLRDGMRAVPETEADATAFLNANASPAELAAANTVPLERDLLIRLIVRRRLGTITGSEDRDFRVVSTMGTTIFEFTEILRRRNPADFAD